MGELLEDIEGALWTLEAVDSSRVGEHPPLSLVVVAVDPAVTAGEESDETGIIVTGKGEDGHGYVLADLSLRGHPAEVARRVCAAYEDYRADWVVAEVNNGGDYVGTLIKSVKPDIGYKTVHSTRGKYLRAEPVAALYEQGRCHHLGTFARLEDQMTGYVPGQADSPDRLDTPSCSGSPRSASRAAGCPGWTFTPPRKTSRATASGPRTSPRTRGRAPTAPRGSEWKT